MSASSSSSSLRVSGSPRFAFRTSPSPRAIRRPGAPSRVSSASRPLSCMVSRSSRTSNHMPRKRLPCLLRRAEQLGRRELVECGPQLLVRRQRVLGERREVNRTTGPLGELTQVAARDERDEVVLAPGSDVPDSAREHPEPCQRADAPGVVVPELPLDLVHPPLAALDEREFSPLRLVRVERLDRHRAVVPHQAVQGMPDRPRTLVAVADLVGLAARSR